MKVELTLFLAEKGPLEVNVFMFGMTVIIRDAQNTGD